MLPTAYLTNCSQLEVLKRWCAPLFYLLFLSAMFSVGFGARWPHSVFTHSDKKRGQKTPRTLHTPKNIAETDCRHEDGMSGVFTLYAISLSCDSSIPVNATHWTCNVESCTSVGTYNVGSGTEGIPQPVWGDKLTTAWAQTYHQLMSSGPSCFKIHSSWEN